jgi:hypothetical protein
MLLLELVERPSSFLSPRHELSLPIIIHATRLHNNAASL